MLHNTTRKSKAEKIADLRFQISDFSETGTDLVCHERGLNEIADWTLDDPICNLKS
jgi:hypothetical protein